MYSSWEHFGLSPPTCCCLSNTPCLTCVQSSPPPSLQSSPFTPVLPLHSSPPPSRQSSPITAISHDALETFLPIYSLMVHYIPATTQHAYMQTHTTTLTTQRHRPRQWRSLLTHPQIRRRQMMKLLSLRRMMRKINQRPRRYITVSWKWLSLSPLYLPPLSSSLLSFLP